MFEKVDMGDVSTNINTVDPRHWIVGYEVVIWADSGQIDGQQAVLVI